MQSIRITKCAWEHFNHKEIKRINILLMLNLMWNYYNKTKNEVPRNDVSVQEWS